MAHRVHLARLALAIVGCAIQFISVPSAQAVAGVPKIGGARLISHIAQHFAYFAIFDLPKSLAAKLEIVTLLINRPAPISVDQNAVIDS